MYQPINLYEYITNEAKLFLLKAGASRPEDDPNSGGENFPIAQLGSVEDLIFKVSEVHPEMMEVSPDPTLVDTLIEISKENAKHEEGRKVNEGRERHFSREQHFNRENQRGRGRQFPNREGRGYQGGRDHFQQRMPSGENVERRGRFSLANQRDNADHEFNLEDRGHLSSTENRNRPRNRGWRGNNRGNENATKRGNRSNDSQENWRKK